MKFSLYFMGYEDEADIPKDKEARRKWTFSRKATLELTQCVLVGRTMAFSSFEVVRWNKV